MLFQLDQLNITPDAFRLLYSIMTAAYHDKMWETTHGILERNSKLSRYKVRAGLDELRREKLIMTKSYTTGIKITLMPVLVEMIYKDFKRKGASQRSRNMDEIKKSQAPKKEGAVATKASRKSSTQTSTQSLPRTTSKPSLRSTFKKENLQTAAVTTTAAPPSKPTTKHPPKTATKLKALDKKPYITTRGTLYKAFWEWLKGYELLSDLDIAHFMKDEAKMLYYWKEFQDYARCWLSRNRQVHKPDMDLSRIKMMKRVAAMAQVA